MGAGVRRIVPLTLGWEDLPKSVSVEGASRQERLREPVPGVLLECDGGWLLLDTGFNAALITDPALHRRFHGDPLIQPVLPGPGEPLGRGARQRRHGHRGDLRRRRQPPAQRPRRRAQAISLAGCRCISQRAELDYGLSARPARRPRHLPRRLRRPSIDWRLADGDAEIAPGVTAVPTAGHTPGHQSFVVTLDGSVGGGGFVFAFDAADLTENIERELPVGGRIGAGRRRP